jgi:uncharacterized protein
VNFVVALAVSVVVIYLTLLLAVWWFQERLVFQPPRRIPFSSPQSRTVSFQAADGTDLFALVVGDYSPGATVLLAFHGNAEIARWLIPWAVEVNSATAALIILPEYRGYDGLTGKPSYIGTRHDALAALQYIRSMFGVPQDDVVYFGHSLGSAIAAELAALHVPRSLILQSPFSSANEMSRRYLFAAPAFLLTRISRVHFDTVARVKELSCPVSVAHGERDMIVPARMGHAVFDAARVKGELLILPSAGHNNVAEAGGEEYWRWLTHAIDLKRAASSDVRGEKRLAP